MAKSKKVMLDALKNSLGVVSVACNAVNISRQTHYRWLREDSKYAEDVAEINEIKKDFIESAFLQMVKDHNPQCVMLGMETICGDRGYSKKMKIDTTIDATRSSLSTDEAIAMLTQMKPQDQPKKE